MSDEQPKHVTLEPMEYDELCVMCGQNVATVRIDIFPDPDYYSSDWWFLCDECRKQLAQVLQEA